MTDSRAVFLTATLTLVAILALSTVGWALPATLTPLLTATPTPEPGIVRAYQAIAPPAIDGQLDDWPIQGGIFLNQANASRVWGSFDSDADGSITCRSQWDLDYLYMGCTILDDILIADSVDIWLDDTVELSFDGKNDNLSFCGPVFCSDDHKYELRVDGSITDYSQPPDPAVNGAIQQQPDGYVIEIAIPVAEFDAGDFTPGKVLGFNLGLIDDDDGGDTVEGHLIWNGNFTWANALDYGDLILDAQPGAVTSTPTQAPTHTPTVTPTPSPAQSPTSTPTQLLALGDALPIACEQSLGADTQGGTNHVSSYGCMPNWIETGPEHVFQLTLAEPTDVDALLDRLTADLDLFLVTDADPASCLAYGDNWISLRGLGPGTYYLVVDGYDGAAGPYRLQVWCPLAPTASPSPTTSSSPSSTPVTPRLYLPILSIS